MILGMFGPAQLGLLFLILIGVLLISVFFNLTLQRAMAAVSEKNQPMAPGLIWLNFIPIPLLNSIWTMVFGIVTCNAMNKDAGKKVAPSALAVVYPSISIFNSILALIMNASIGYRGPNEVLAVIVALLSITSFILWIIFWAQMGTATNKLKGISVRAGDSDTLDGGVTQQAPQQPSTPSEKEKLEALREYQALLKDGVITQEEFDKKKGDLLG